MSSKKCCGTSVGVLIWSPDRTELLMIERGTLPAGIAPVAGHALDEHADYAAAAREEVAEEIGLEVTGLTLHAVGGFHPGRCRRAGSTGHTWKLYTATVRGQLAASKREVAFAGWWNRGELQHLAERTADHAAGLISAKAFAARPGLEPVWCRWMRELGLIDLPGEDLAAIERLAATPPSLHA